MKWMIWLVGVCALVLAGALAGLRFVGDDVATWHQDPVTIERAGRSNDYLAAPKGVRAAGIDRVLSYTDLPGRELLFLFDSIARNAPRTRVIAGSVEEGHITYVQRSLVFAFPDYISVKAIEGPDGAGLVIWSRSRFGKDDLGVNKKRIDRWLAQMGI